MANRVARIILTVAALAASAGGASTTAPAVTTLVDAAHGGVASHEITLPAGWTAEGGAWWPTTQATATPPSVRIRASGPDGRRVDIGPPVYAIDPRPSPRFGAQRPADGAYEKGLVVAPTPESPEAWAAAALRVFDGVPEPTATNVTFDSVVTVHQPDADLQQRLEPARAALRAQYGERPMPGGSFATIDAHVYAAIIRDDVGGTRWARSLFFATYCYAFDSANGGERRWSIEPCVLFRCPDASLSAELPSLLSIAQSVRMTDAWATRRAEHLAKLGVDPSPANDRWRVFTGQPTTGPAGN